MSRQSQAIAKAEARKAEAAAFIQKVIITKNGGKSGWFSSGKTVDVANGVVNLKYYESLLQDHVAADITFVDAGNAIHNKTALSGLPIVGEENVQLKFSDNNGNTLAFNNKGNTTSKLANPGGGRHFIFLFVEFVGFVFSCSV